MYWLIIDLAKTCGYCLVFKAGHKLFTDQHLTELSEVKCLIVYITFCFNVV